MRVADALVAGPSVAVGFFGGLFLVAVLELLAGVSWVVGLMVLAVIAVIVLFESVTDKLFDRVLPRMFPQSGNASEGRGNAALARYATASGVVLAFAATRVWTLTEIMEIF